MKINFEKILEKKVFHLGHLGPETQYLESHTDSVSQF